MMRVGIVGLGLIGGSLAKAYKRHETFSVYGWDADKTILDFASLAQAIDGELSPEILPSCTLILLATYPKGVLDWLRAHADQLPTSCTVIDCGGTKQEICAVGFALAAEYGFTFVGGHPMAGVQHSGFRYSREDLFDGAPMVIVPPSFDDIRLLERIKSLLAPVGFGRISLTEAAEHDRVIAFTSQLAHVISNAYVKSPTASSHQGFSAGSYRDLTRVAWLNPEMWTELFMENRKALLFELDVFLASLGQYRDALEAGDADSVRRLLEEGRQRKKEVDGP